MSPGRIGTVGTIVAALIGGSVVVTLRGAAPSTAGGASLAKLKAGNAHFVASPSDGVPVDASKRLAHGTGSTPGAAVLTCADSTVPPEIVFHAGPGELFVVRAAGHVADRSVVASLEHAVQHLHVPLLVVMGHESCSVVRSTLDTPPTQAVGPNLDYLFKAIRPAAMRSTGQAGDGRLRAAILENVEETINELLRSSVTLKFKSATNAVTLVGAYYELATGRVHFSDVVALAPAGGAPHAGAQQAPHH